LPGLRGRPAATTQSLGGDGKAQGKVSGPQVEVIGYTTFIGVPQGCRAESPRFHGAQDEGTDMARLIECAGRCCYDSYGRGRASAEFHQHLREVGHLSVIEHASLSFFISGISRGCSHELVRHRVGVGISQRSTRYVDESESEWVWHPLVEPTVTGVVSHLGRQELVEKARQLYDQIRNAVESFLTEEQGCDRMTARKQARGAARGVLGNALATELVWTANLRALRHFLELRATDHADAEIRLLANRLQESAVDYCPEWLLYAKRPAADGIGWVINGE